MIKSLTISSNIHVDVCLLNENLSNMKCKLQFILSDDLIIKHNLIFFIQFNISATGTD